MSKGKKKNDVGANYVQTTSNKNTTDDFNITLTYGNNWQVGDWVKQDQPIVSTSSWKFPNSDEQIDALTFQIQCLIKEVKKLRKVIQKTIEDAGNDTE